MTGVGEGDGDGDVVGALGDVTDAAFGRPEQLPVPHAVAMKAIAHRDPVSANRFNRPEPNLRIGGSTL